ncbi:hypothetical protein D3C84_873000 [compost metagenome]
MLRPAIDADEVLVQEDEGSPGRNALVRKAGQFLPSLSVRIWMHGNGRLEPEPSDLLTGEYIDRWHGPRRDFNLNASRWSKVPHGVRATWMHNWPGLCLGGRIEAEAAVRDSEVFAQHIAVAVQSCAEERKVRLSQGEARASRLSGAAKEQELRELQKDIEMYQTLETAIAHPRIDLDVVGAIFVSSSSPFEA